MSYTIYFSVTRRTTFAYVSSQGEEGRKATSGPNKNINNVCNQRRRYSVVTMVTFNAPLNLFLCKYNLSLTGATLSC